MPGGKPPSKIDWLEVDRLLIEGNSGTQVAAKIGINPATLYDRTLKDKGVMFHEYSQEKKAKGDALLKSKQMEVAMKGNVSMLIWLGKQRLEQKDRAEKEAASFTPEQLQLMTTLIDQIRKSQGSALDNANNNNSNE